MHKIEQTALKTYQNNLAYFQEKHPTLHSKLSALDLLLSDGRYPAQFDLEYKDNYFDIKELASGHYLYNENPQAFTTQQLSDFNLKKDHNVIESFYNYKFTPEALKKVETADALTMHATTAPIIHYCSENATAAMNMKQVNKFIFLGLGLAIHLPKMVKKVAAQTYFIVEDNLEIFRLSLFVTDYTNLFTNATAYFSIAENDQEFDASFNQFYLHAFIRNHYLKFSLFNDTYLSKVSRIQTAIVSRPEIVYPHELQLYKNVNVLKHLHENFSFLNLRQTAATNQLTTKPALVIGAGPSLKKELDWLSKHHQNFTLIVALAALKTLHSKNIKPDIVVQVDEKVIETEHLINSFDSLDFLTDSIFIFSASVPQILFDSFNPNTIFLTEDRTHYRKSDIYLESASVGENAYALALLFNFSDIYLLGLDFALDPESGQTHADEHQLSQKIDLNSNEHQSVASLRDSLLNIPGNFREQVPTTPLLYQSIPILNQFTTTYKSHAQQCFNLNDGALLEGIEPLKTSAITTNNAPLDKAQLHQEILEFLQSQMSIETNNKELLQRRTFIKQYKDFITIFETTKLVSSEKFVQHYSTLLQNILSVSHNELHEILLNYLLKSSTWIIDLFNTKELNNPKHHVKKMQKIVVLQLKKILDLYEESLENAIKDKTD